MLGFIGRWAASKGMVSVPNLIGLLNTAAQTAIANSGLTYSSSSSTNTGDSGLANKVASQTPTSGTLADYESSVSFVYYNYVAPPFFPPFFPPYFAPAPFFPPYFAPAPFFPPFFPPYFPFFPPYFPFFPPFFPFFPFFPSFPATCEPHNEYSSECYYYAPWGYWVRDVCYIDEFCVPNDCGLSIGACSQNWP